MVNQITLSLANTGKRYAEAQMRVWDDGNLHFQVPDISIAKGEQSRKYGFAFTLLGSGKALPDVIAAIKAESGLDTRKSLATKRRDYVRVQINMRGGSTMHVQFRTSNGKNKNRSYGFSFDIAVPAAVAAALRAALA